MRKLFILVVGFTSFNIFAGEVIQNAFITSFKGKEYTCPSDRNITSCLWRVHGVSKRVIANELTEIRERPDYSLTFNIGDKKGSDFKCPIFKSPESCLREKYAILLNGSSIGKFTACSDWMKKTFPEDNLITLTDDGKVIRNTKGANTPEFYNDKDPKNITASFSSKNPKDKQLEYGVEVNFIQVEGDEEGYRLTRTHRNENWYSANWNQFQGINYNMAYPQMAASQITEKTDITIANFKIGKNGKCYVANVGNTNSNSQYSNGDSKKCFDILEFQKENPQLAKCADPKIFDKLNELLGKPITKTTRLMNAWETKQADYALGSQRYKYVSASERFKEALSLPQKVLEHASDEIDKCSKFNLDSFAMDEKLFKADTSGKAPASETGTAVIPET